MGSPQWITHDPGTGDLLLADWTTQQIWRMPGGPLAGGGPGGLPTDPNGDGGPLAAAAFDYPSGQRTRP